MVGPVWQLYVPSLILGELPWLCVLDHCPAEVPTRKVCQLTSTEEQPHSAVFPPSALTRVSFLLDQSQQHVLQQQGCEGLERARHETPSYRPSVGAEPADINLH